MRFAIVGCGVIHGTHVSAIRSLPDLAELVAVCDENPEKAKAAGEKQGVPFFTDLAEMLQQDFDTLTVCTPSGLHAKQGVMGANAGKHIVCEKPIDVSLEAADALIQACEKNRVKLVVISQHRYSTGIRALQQFLSEGRLGSLCYAESVTKWYRSQEYYDSGGWRGTWELDGGGALMNQGVHYVDQLRWAMGPVKSVAATMATRAHERIEVEDVVSASIEFESGAVGTLLASTAMYPGYAQAIEVYGTGGAVIVENSRLKHAQFAGDPPLVQNFERQGEGPDAKTTPVEAGFNAAADPTQVPLDGHIEHLKDLIEAVRDDRDPFMSGKEARAALELIVGVYRAARTGERVYFPLK
ncbi:MAG: Gfo/Idh/MocA family oxidoreductase [Cytophagales bacterium]|nr:Gfo/Idh/MocA family oxidoreductase [Armatimonadota bacterium]